MISSKQFKKIAQGRIFRFFGGIHPKEMKDTSQSPVESLKIPSLICLPIERHLGSDGEILVNIGDHVKRGQKLTEPKGRLVPCHATTSGTISSICPEVLPHPSGFTGLCITIKPDGLDERVERDPIRNWETVDNDTLLSRIHDYGVEGMGGAQFQTDFKIRSAITDSKDGCNILIINGCECEPAITCDDRIMQEMATDIATGIKILNKILSPKITIVAIEENKSTAIKAMQNACAGVAQLRVLKVKYPQGAARNLIKAVTGIEIPYSEHTSNAGIVVNNVATVLAVKEAIVDGIPVTDRVVTMTGNSLKKKGNVRVRLGTSVRFLLSNFGLNPEYHQRIVMGGPMMGFTLPSIDVPVTKTTSCILAPDSTEIPRLPSPTNCIRCGRCARVCPSRLVPYQMYSQSVAKNHAACQKCGIKDCTLCGACSYVCPSAIPLTSQFRYEKAVERHIYEAEVRNERARKRMEIHDQRVREEEALREKKKAEALERIKAQKEAEAKMTPEELAKSRAEAAKKAREEALKRRNELKAQNQEAEIEKAKIEALKKSEERSREISRHQGHVAQSILPESSFKEEVKAEKTPEELLALPEALKKMAGVRENLLKIAQYQHNEAVSHVDELVGLEPDDSLQNPEPKKVIAQVLMSHDLEVKENNTLPQALKKKTMRQKK
ncbi:MAG: electron transport complex subunit RsxC [Succinivibrio sp.]